MVEAQIQKLLDTKKIKRIDNYKPEVKEQVLLMPFMKMDIRVGTILDCQRK